jgi:argininosuccinate lyase
MKKPWGGRFKEKTAKTLEKFSESVSFDQRLWKEDIEGSIAHAKMLNKQGIINDKEFKLISKGLKEIEKEIEQGNFHLKQSLKMFT